MKKRFLAMFLALVMCAALLPMAALAADSDFAITDEVLTSYVGKDTDVVIPSGVKTIGGSYYKLYYPPFDDFSMIPSYWERIRGSFQNCGSVTSVTIPDGVTTIGTEAFQGCKNLSSVTIPDSVTSIASGAFADCTSLKSITIPDSLHKIEGRDLQIPYAGPVDPLVIAGTFEGCSGLTSVTIPASVTAIGPHAFLGCTSLKDIYYGGSKEQWNAIELDTADWPDYRYTVLKVTSRDFKTDLRSATIHYNSTGPSSQPTTVPAVPTNDKLTVDGSAAAPAAYKINGANYFKLRDVAMMLNNTAGQFSVDYDGTRNAIIITTGQPYSPVGGELGTAPVQSAGAAASNDAVYINGERVELTAYKINGANYYGIRDLGQKLGFNVGWTAERGMFIESNKPYDPNN